MGRYFGVDWAGKRWIVVSVTDCGITVDAQPSLQTVWDQYHEADQILVDIPIGLPDSPEMSPRPCDDQARDVVAGSRYSSVFDVPCRTAVRESDHGDAQQRNKEQLDDDSLGPQKCGFSERVHEADVFMRRADTEGKV